VSGITLVLTHKLLRYCYFSISPCHDYEPCSTHTTGCCTPCCNTQLINLRLTCHNRAAAATSNHGWNILCALPRTANMFNISSQVPPPHILYLNYATCRLLHVVFCACVCTDLHHPHYQHLSKLVSDATVTLTLRARLTRGLRRQLPQLRMILCWERLFQATVTYGQMGVLKLYQPSECAV
jgi:hypothetical protein